MYPHRKRDRGWIMMTSYYGKAFRVTGPLWGESTGRSSMDSPHRGPVTPALMFSLKLASTNGWINFRDVGDLRRHDAHCDVIVTITTTFQRYMVKRQLHDDLCITMTTQWASQITSGSIVYSIICSDADQRNHQGSASLAFVGEFIADRWISRTKASNAENVSIWWRHHGNKKF